MGDVSDLELPDELEQQLADRARAEGVTASDLAAEGIRQLLASRPHDPRSGDEPSVPGRRFVGFVSYSHTDKAVAARLHRRLEQYRVPRSLVGLKTRNGVVPRRLRPFFRDEDEFATSANLGERITVALRSSTFLIVICSPRAAASRWVNQEIVQFRRAGGSPRVLCLIASGDPGASVEGKPEAECFPPALFAPVTSAPGNDAIPEPQAADIREGHESLSKASLRLIAEILGVDFEDLWQRDRRRYRAQIAMLAVAVVLAGIATGLGIRSNLQARQEVGRANVAAAASLWDRLDSRDPGRLSPEELNVLWEFALAADPVRNAAADELESDAERIVRLGRRPEHVMRSLFLVWPQDRLTRLTASILRAMSASSDDGAQAALGAALLAAIARMAPAHHAQVATAIGEALQRTNEPAHVAALAPAVLQLPGTRGTSARHLAFTRLQEAIPRATSGDQLHALAAAVTRWPRDDAAVDHQAAFTALFERSRTISRRPADRVVSLQDLQRLADNRRTIIDALALLVQTLTPSQAAAVLPSALEAFPQAKDFDEQQVVGRTVAALSARNLPAEAASSVLPTVVQRVRTANGTSAREALADAWAGLIGALTEAQARTWLASALAGLHDAQGDEERQVFAGMTLAIADKLPVAEAQRPRAEALRVLLGASNPAFQVVLTQARSGIVDGPQYEAMQRATQQARNQSLLRELSAAFTAAAITLPSDRLVPTFEALWPGLQGAGPPAQVTVMQEAIKAVAARATSREAGPMFGVLVRNFPGRDGMIDSARLEAVGEIGVAVVQRMSPQQKQGVFEPILDRLRGTPHAYARKSVATIVVALADGLLPAQRRVARETMQSMLAWSERVPESVAAAGALLALSGVSDPANGTADPLLDAASYPTLPAETVAVLRLRLHSQSVGAQTSRPLCPPPPRSGLSCPATASAGRR